MPPRGLEVYLTELETEVLSIFVKRKFLQDKKIAEVLRVLVQKLEGTYYKETKQ